LNYVHISDSQITDESLRLLSELPNLEGLSLQFNRFTNQGVGHLQRLRRLKSLWLCGKRDRPNDIGDGSLEFLFELSGFSSLGVQNTKVTPEFANRLTSRFPKCSIAK
jgi:hypothetical protein